MGNDGPARTKLHWLTEALAWGLPLLVYLLIVIPASIHNRDALSPDAVGYIRRALYLSQGLISDSVSGYWSPLLSWSIAPVIWAGMDPLHAARVALVFWGVILLVSVHAFIRVFTTWNWRWRTAVMSVIALIVVIRAVRQITPDVALAACLFSYFAALCSSRFDRSRRWQLLTGMLGGAAYLAKSYGLPFVAAHLVATFILRYVIARRQRDPSTARPLLKQFGMAVFGWLLVVVPWIAVLSVHYGTFTTNTVGGLARAMIGPGQLDEQESFENRIFFFTPPEDPFVAQIENPDRTHYAPWSPFESLDLMGFQLRLIWKHALKCGHFLVEFSALKLTLITIVVGAFISLGWPRVAGLEWWRAVWLLGTSALFCSGFLLVYVEARYIDTLVLVLLLILGIAIIHGIARGHNHLASKITRGVVAAGLLAAYAWPLIDSFSQVFHPNTYAIYREVATLLEKHGLKGTTATTNRYAGMYIALHSDEKQQTIVALSLEHPLHREMEHALLAGQPKSIVIWTESKRRDRIEDSRARAYALALVKRLGWVRKFRMNKWGRSVQAYAPVKDDPDPYSPAPYSPTTQSETSGGTK